MSLDVPTVDDRTYDELLEDARKLLPAYAAAWTDHNAHDPGVTILELLAWLTETYGYQFDRVTDAHRLQYLRLLGETPAPPTTARAELQFAVPEAAHGTTVPAGTPLVAEDGAAPARPFETTRDVTLLDAAIETVLSDYPTGRADRSDANGRPGVSYFAFGEAAEPGSALYLGFEGDPFRPADGEADAPPVAVTFRYDDDGLPPVGDGVELSLPPRSYDEPVRNGNGADETGRSLSVSAERDRSPFARSPFVPSVDLVWEYCTAYDDWANDDAWESFDVLADETNSLYAGGTVTLALPTRSLPADRTWPDAPGVVLDAPAPRHWVRCRVAGPVGEPGYEVPPRLDAIRLNVVPAVQVGRETDETLSRPDGEDRTTALPGQRFRFERSPVRDAAVTVDGDEWRAVESLDASGPDDAHFVLDRVAGEVVFGDDVRGAVPPVDAPVVATEYAWGGGTESNVSASATWAFDTAASVADGVAIRPLTAATGGAVGETIDDAFERVRRDLSRSTRAVTAADFREITLTTPGVRFGRTHAVVESAGNDDRCASTTVRVVAMPYSPRPKPLPSRGFLDAVRCHLRRHALLTDSVTVQPPRYVDVDVSVRLELLPRQGAAGTTAAVERALEEFLGPLTGFEGTGWPFGRPVYLSELYETVDSVDGVDCVLDVDVTAGTGGTVDADGNAVVGTLGLPSLRRVEVTVETGRDRCGEVGR